MKDAEIDEEVKREIQKIFGPRDFIERIFSPEKSIQISDRPVITFLIADLNRSMDDEKTTRAFAEQMVRECGMSARTFKSALIWVVAESAQPMREEARKILAWLAIGDEADDLKLDEGQKRQLAENIQKARRDLKESIWRGYKHLLLLAKDNILKKVDLGLVHSSAADSPISNILNRLSSDGDVELKGVGPNFLTRNWPPAFKEWSTRSLRDAFYASPTYPRVPNAEFIKGTIARGVENGMLAYVGKTAVGKYLPFAFKQSIDPSDIEFSDDMFVVAGEVAQAYLDREKLGAPFTTGVTGDDSTGATGTPDGASTPGPSGASGKAQPTQTQPTTTTTKVAGIKWAGEVPPQKTDEFLYQGAFPICGDFRLETHDSGGGQSARWAFKANPGGDSGSFTGTRP